MKRHLLTLSLALLTTPALAQSRPFRMTLGGSTAKTRDLFWFGASLDTKRLTPQRTLSFYAESAFSLGSGSGTSVDPNAPPSAATIDGFDGVGFSVRQSRGYGWVGVGLGSYLTTFSGGGAGGGAGTRKRTELGGKVFAGVGGGLYFTELTLTLPSVTQAIQAGISVGFRL